MANFLTRKGVETCLKIASGAGTSVGESGLAYAGTQIILMHSSSTPVVNPSDATYGAIGASGKDFFEVATGNGYTSGGITIDETDWTYDAANNRITLADQSWTASGGTIAGIAGAFIANAANQVLVYWTRDATTLADGATFTLDDLTITFG